MNINFCADSLQSGKSFMADSGKANFLTYGRDIFAWVDGFLHIYGSKTNRFVERSKL